MAESKVTQKDIQRQEKGLRLIVEGGAKYEKPSIIQILDEIELVFMNPIRSAYHLLDSDNGAAALAESLLFTTLSHWDKFARDLADCFRKQLKLEKKESTFEDHRFWEYVAQIQIDKHDPADILEAWLKEHNPDYFEDSEATDTGSAESAENQQSHVSEQ